LMPREVTITVDDREDSTTIKLPDNFYGDVTLLFKAGVLVNTKQVAVKTKQELKGGSGRSGRDGRGGPM